MSFGTTLMFQQQQPDITISSPYFAENQNWERGPVKN
jgi:hypothetical protein